VGEQVKQGIFNHRLHRLHGFFESWGFGEARAGANGPVLRASWAEDSSRSDRGIRYNGFPDTMRLEAVHPPWQVVRRKPNSKKNPCNLGNLWFTSLLLPLFLRWNLPSTNLL
jgi:hypothetical protein